MNRTSRYILLVLVSVSLVACAQSSERTDLTDAAGLDIGPAADMNSAIDADLLDAGLPDAVMGTATVADIAATYASSLCARVDDCYGPAADVFFRGIDCVALYTNVLANAGEDALERAVASGSLTFHGENLALCAAAIATASCADVNGAELAACAALFTGNVSVGGACITDAECAGNSFCLGGASCPAVCATEKSLGAGCVRNEECSSRYCSSNARACATRAALGEACEGSTASECQFGLVCVGSDEATGQAGTCRDEADLFIAGEGERCSLDGGPWCREGLSCAVVQTRPTVAFECRTLSTSGAPCTFGIPDACPTGEYCNANVRDGIIDGTCTGLPTTGELCANDAIGAHCSDGTACGSDGLCHDVHGNGAACGENTDCYSGYCSADVCAAAPACF
ncbi:MAG: hypothetical protein IPK60_21850 [Sandaracinaceae bacterium]|nr:hypothetical protein [Sandaracinaceae bacterium]